MDFFGIGQALTGCLEIYFRSARMTGRTTNLIESVKDGDMVVFSTHKDRVIFVRELNARGLSCATMVCDPVDINGIFKVATSKGRTIFDHRFVEEFYTNSLNSAISTLERVQIESSGYGEAHLKTKEQAVNRKWFMR